MNAVLSDVHGNLPALEAVLDDLYYHPIDRIIFAGDFIGGPQPVETFLRLSSVEAIMITGNSDTNLTKLRTGQAPREWHDSLDSSGARDTSGRSKTRNNVAANPIEGTAWRNKYDHAPGNGSFSE
jgi:predicted phosphodiesterase